MFINNQAYLATPGDTLISVELDVPAKDNIMGWEYELEFEPGKGSKRFTKTAVKDSAGTTTTLFAPRLPAALSANQLTFQVKLGDLQCDQGDGSYATCSGGRFSLKSIKALSWFSTATPPVGITTTDADSRATAASNSGTFTKKSVRFGSPLASAANTWDGIFYVGECSRNTQVGSGSEGALSNPHVSELYGSRASIVYCILLSQSTNCQQLSLLRTRRLLT